MSNEADLKMIEQIQELNFSYLNLAKQMIISDKKSAVIRLGISMETADLIESMTNAQLMKFCRANQLIPKLGHVDKSLIKTAITQNSDFIPHKIHSTILLSSAPQT